MTHFLKLLTQVILAPKNGWEDIDAESDYSSGVLSRGLVPLLLLTALSVFIRKIYHSDVSIISLIQQSIIVFAAFFITIYIAEFFFSLFFIRNIAGELKPHRIRIFIYYCIGAMAMMTLLIGCVPFSPVLILLPLYSIVVMRMGADYLEVLPERIGNFMILSLLSVFIPPFLIIFLFGMLIGS